MVFVPILLLNMLIAMMGNTYAHVIEQSEKEWVKQWAKIVIALERAIPQSDAQHYLQEYSISLGPSEQDPTIEKRGVLIIKSKSKTRAKQRKGAVANWKVHTISRLSATPRHLLLNLWLQRVGKVTINALKKKGLTGEEMRCLMWGRESINTPIKVKKPIKDPLSDPQGPNLTGGFGDALTTALDVMAFTHDLDIVSASQGLNLATNTKPVTTTTPTTTVTNTVTINNQINSALNAQQKAIAGAGVGAMAMIGTVTQLTDSQGHIATTKNTKKDDGVKATSSEDPFRELVINSNDSNCDPEKLKMLALSAADLRDVEEVSISKQQPKSVKSLAGIFAGTETFVRKVEETIKKKYAALDPSDSEGFGGI